MAKKQESAESEKRKHGDDDSSFSSEQTQYDSAFPRRPSLVSAIPVAPSLCSGKPFSYLPALTVLLDSDMLMTIKLLLARAFKSDAKIFLSSKKEVDN
jgi:hypothetical protein